MTMFKMLIIIVTFYCFFCSASKEFCHGEGHQGCDGSRCKSISIIQHVLYILIHVILVHYGPYYIVRVIKMSKDDGRKLCHLYY